MLGRSAKRYITLMHSAEFGAFGQRRHDRNVLGDWAAASSNRNSADKSEPSIEKPCSAAWPWN